jgi:hypothetical protein
LTVITRAATGERTPYWVFEAEVPVGMPVAPMTILEHKGASGNMAIAAPEDEGNGKGSSVYELRGVPDGAYTVWVRALWDNGCANSVGCAVGDQRIVISDEIFKRWHWVPSLRQLKLPAGDGRLRLVATEANIMIDQILLVGDPRFVPHGMVRPVP